MNEISETLNTILSEFTSEENSIWEKLQNLRSRRKELLNSNQSCIRLQLDTPEDALSLKDNALERNKAWKKELNISLSKLRSKQCYNPAEDNLNHIIDKYSEILSREDVD